MKDKARLPEHTDLDFVSRPGDRIQASWVGFSGVVGLSVALIVVVQLKLPPLPATLLVLTLTSMPMLLLEWVVNRVYLRESSGLTSEPGPVDLRRCARKLAGFMMTVGALFVLYWLLPEYRKPFYKPVYELLVVLMPLVFLSAWFYIRWVDCRQIWPEDIYARLGGCLFGEWTKVDRQELVQHGLSWLVKGFFLPVMLGFLCSNMRNLANHPPSVATFADFFITSVNVIFIMDVSFGVIGYFFTLRALDAQIRMPESALSGWLLALICYPPFLSVVAGSFYDVPGDYNWENWLGGWPVPYLSWGFAILVLYAGYVWATVCFGCRFSNLTHRGIITYGPYRYVKHPAYVCKCLAWWMIAVPFVCHSSWFQCLQAMLLLGIKTSIYWGRARTEERLLGQDPAYRAYSGWIEEYGIIAQAQKWARKPCVSASKSFRALIESLFALGK